MVGFFIVTEFEDLGRFATVSINGDAFQTQLPRAEIHPSNILRFRVVR